MLDVQISDAGEDVRTGAAGEADLCLDVIEAAVAGAEVDGVDVELVVELLLQLVVLVVLLQTSQTHVWRRHLWMHPHASANLTLTRCTLNNQTPP